MEGLKLTEHEKTLFEDLFQMCDLGKTAKIPKLVAGELLALSGLPTDVSLQIADMCGASRLGYFGRSQFYIALKLIAVAQQQLPLSFESFANNLPLPVINIAALNTNLANYDPSMYTLQPDPQPPPPMAPPVQMMSGGVLPPPPTKKHVRNMSGTIQQAPVPMHVQSHPATAQLNNSHMMLPTVSAAQVIMSQSTPQVPTQSQSVSQSNPTIPETGVGWASFPSPTKASGQELPVTSVSTKRTQSPNKVTTPGDGPTAPLDWNSFGGSKRSFNFDSCSLSSADYATSEAESMDDVWSINEEQREYYVNQFMSMQPDLTATIKGAVAKEFFEKSKLPTKELSKIWKLSDVNRDGALTLQEFCTAMHLVVLRRNDVELPASLPASLMPYIPASSEPFAADLGEEQSDRSPSPAPPPTTQHKTSWSRSISDGPASSATNWSVDNMAQWQDQQTGSDQWTNPDQQWQQTGSEASSNWRGASDSSSPINAQWTGSSHSPKSKPVNFDSAPAIGDPEIAHPVAVKMSPSTQNQMMEGMSRPRTDSDPLSYETSSTPHVTRHRSNTESLIASDQQAQPLPVRPRPTPKKTQSMGAPTMDHKLKYPPPQSVHGYQSLPGAPTPPTVPPRNHLSISSPDPDMLIPNDDNIDPFFSQGDTMNENFADFSTKFGEPTNEPFGAPAASHNRSEGVLHHQPSVSMQPVMLPTAPKEKFTHQFSIRDKREIQNSIRAQRERNTMLVRINSELNSELQEVMEQRISLEIQLEHLKPC